jgi:pimeloyl-ACP methyl ester carboxylesterase
MLARADLLAWIPALALAAPIAAPDTVVLKGGKKLENVVVSRQDEQFVVVNPWNSRWKEMAFEIPEKCRIARDKVEQVIVAEPPLVEYRRAASKPGLKPEDHAALAKRCAELGLKDEQAREAKLALGPTPADELARAYVAAKTPEERAAKWKELKALPSPPSLVFLERARRSAALPKGRRDKVRLTMRSEEAPGATYCVFVPRSYDPLVPTGLVVGLHGGGPGGFDSTIVTGSGEEAMPFYEDVAEATGLIVVCPTALAPGWSSGKNEPLVDATLEEMLALFDVDENRIYLTGHSMGGGGAWHWGPKRAEVWAAFAPCAGWGGPTTKGLPVYIYHGSDDAIVGPDSDRASARVLLDDKKKNDFVYTEVDQVGHGFPDWVRRDVFQFFLGRWKDRGKKRSIAPDSSFDRKPSREEIRCFGDPTIAPGAEGAGGVADDPKLGELSSLIGRLEKGGGGGEEAATELAKSKDPATVKAIARVLHSKKASGDARALAARALGEIGTPECVKPLATAADDEEFRVVDAVTVALGKTRSKDALEPLARAARRMGELFDGSIRGGEMVFTEYQIRTRSFALLCDAFAAIGDAPAALPLLQSELVARVFTPKSPYRIPTDERFDEIPWKARLELVKRLRACLETLADPHGAELLRSIKSAWPSESALAKECDAGVAKLGG